jgi:hypothetical protein
MTDSNHILTFSGSKIQASSIGFVTGPFRYWTAARKDLQFPVGKANYFAPVILSKKNGDTAIVEVEYFAFWQPFPDSAITFPVKSVSNSEYWRIKKIFPADSLPSQDILRLSLGSNSTNNIIGQPLLVRMASTAVKWELLPLYADNPISNTVASAPSILRTGIYTFGSMFPSALSREILELCQQERNGFTRLSWITDIDEQVKQYVMEKSSGNGPYVVMDSILSKNKIGKVSYSFDLRTSQIKGNFIRLRSVDKKGRTVYSNVLYIRPTSEILRVYPNPANKIIKIEAKIQPHATVQVLNPMGQVIHVASWFRENQLEIDISKLQPGKYNLALNAGDKKRVFTFMKQ